MVEVSLTLAPPALPLLSHHGGNACNPDNLGQNKGSRRPSAPGGDTSNTSVTSSSKALGTPEAQAAMIRAAVARGSPPAHCSCVKDTYSLEEKL